MRGIITYTGGKLNKLQQNEILSSEVAENVKLATLKNHHNNQSSNTSASLSQNSVINQYIHQKSCGLAYISETASLNQSMGHRNVQM